VVGLAREVVEERPRAPRQPAHEGLLGLLERQVAWRAGPAGQPGKAGGHEPQPREGEQHGMGGRDLGQHRRGDGGREDGGRPHLARDAEG